ncbi:pantoate--beta-alanine ligase [Gallaecimonas xiamenensis]|uniref:Pantothenate synthetase n=1 Tax=Gallaecimonas xiamenensis 3-C-1 TaxID=745411 RepID=K2JTK5_9GAMM|nr:pantoate--beta-alanine ligase [Gallaecimonas xiamenensis]EKE73689.1 pantoate--beta-alanine ligase [Gallaecimonas xiamenensis 3-C-1]
MRTVHSVKDLRAQVKAWRQKGERVALVPTMGNLHEGHLTLVREAKHQADRVVVSIFVNPLQFGAGEDLGAYPRTPEEDSAALFDEGVDLLFMPSVEVLYPNGMDDHTKVEVPGISELYCGQTRPGHFRGVATVVCKLLNLVQPDLACFGMKDYQQLAVIRRMVDDLAMPVDIQGVPTVRAEDGLALSSRNGYLTGEERAKAPALYAALTAMADALKGGRRDFEALVDEAKAKLSEAGFTPDYLYLLNAQSLATATGEDQELVILAAAYLGKARLIDNLLVDLQA